MHAAHDVEDVLAHDQIGRCEDVAAYQGPFAVGDAGVVVVQFFLVLRKRVPGVGNRGHAETDHQARVGFGIAHEIAMQAAFDHGFVERIGVAGKMIHADFDVAECVEQLFAQFVQGAFFGAAGQIGFVEAALAIVFQPWHMRVAVKGQTIRREAGGFFDGVAHAVQLLMRQAEHEVVADGGVADATGGFVYACDVFKWLNAVDGLLHLRVVVLNAKAYATKAQIVQGL